MMKSNLFKGLSGVILAAMIAGASMTAYAAYDPFAAMEAKTRQLVAEAIAAGRVPPGTTIYECAYGKDAGGNTVIVQYMDDSGAWIDLSSGQAPVPQEQAPSRERLSGETLAEYAAECFALVNEERERAGLEAVSYSEEVAGAAMIRAKEIESHMEHIRPDGSSCFTVLDDAGVESTWAAENLHKGRSGPEAAMKAWMESDGHRKNLLNGKATGIGIAAYQAENGRICWVQLLVQE